MNNNDIVDYSGLVSVGLDLEVRGGDTCATHLPGLPRVFFCFIAESNCDCWVLQGLRQASGIPSTPFLGIYRRWTSLQRVYE